MSTQKLDPTKVKIANVRAALKKQKLSLEGTDEELVERLVASESTKKGLAQCDVCHGISSAADHAACPFCGSADEPPPKAAKSKKPETVAAPEEAKPPTRTRTQKSEPPKVTSPPRGVEKAEPSTKKPKKSKDLEAPSAPLKPKPQKLVRVVPTDTEVVSVKTLDSAVKEIRKAQEQGGQAVYTIGRKLIEIEEQGLFTLRTEQGKQKFRTMKEFCEDELGINKAYAQKLADVARAFTPEDMKVVGPTKLALLVSVKPGEDRDRLLEAAKSGVTRGSLEAEVKKLDDGARGREVHRGGMRGHVGEVSGPLPSKKPRAQVEVEPSEPLTTVVFQDQVQQLVFLDAAGQPTKKADGATATEVSANGVVLKYEILKNDEGHLSLRITRQR